MVENHVLSLKHIILQYINSYNLPLKKAIDQLLGVVKISRPGLQLCHHCKAAILKKGGKLRPGNLYTPVCVSLHIYIYTVSQEECARLRESVSYVKVYRYNPKHLYPKLNGYRDNGLRKVGASCGSKYCNLHS